MGRSLIFLPTIVRSRFRLKKAVDFRIDRRFPVISSTKSLSFQASKRNGHWARERFRRRWKYNVGIRVECLFAFAKVESRAGSGTRYSQKSPSELNRPRINKRFLPLNRDAVADINVPYLSFEMLVTSF